MKQFKFQFNEQSSFVEELFRFKQRELLDANAKMLFVVYTEVLETDVLDEVRGAIEVVFPTAEYMGCSTSGNIIDCNFATGISVVCTLFEKETTRIMLRQYEMSGENVEDVTRRITEEVAANPWVKAVELYFNIFSGLYMRFCEGMADIPKGVQIFGGVTCSDDITSDKSCVFTKAGGYSTKSVVAVFYGGSDFYVGSVRITGWKPLKRNFRVTKASGCTLNELDGVPAYEIYRRYLGIPNDKNFFYNTLEFPLLYERNGIWIIRALPASNPDGSIDVSADIEEGATVHFAYGDPRTIVGSVKRDSRQIRKFQPDVLHIFSCAARKAFWDADDPTYELASLRNISSSAGFFTHGEFIRMYDHLNSHNITLVIAAMREGAPKAASEELMAEAMPQTLAKVPLVSRLATFIAEFSRELEDMNEKLRLAAISDGMTGLCNRKEIQARIEAQLAQSADKPISLIMLDLDNFKQVNDTYGHQKGDEVIVALANILRAQAAANKEAAAGRWGGEEFMLLLPDKTLDEAVNIAEEIRESFAGQSFEGVPSQTVSIGVTQAAPGDTIDPLCIRVDTALYAAKKAGKNRVLAK